MNNYFQHRDSIREMLFMLALEMFWPPWVRGIFILRPFFMVLFIDFKILSLP
jgi:hypothetical protein